MKMPGYHQDMDLRRVEKCRGIFYFRYIADGNHVRFRGFVDDCATCASKL